MLRMESPELKLMIDHQSIILVERGHWLCCHINSLFIFSSKKEAHQKLRNEINDVVEAQKTANGKNQLASNANIDPLAYRQISDSIIGNLREQITFLSSVRFIFQQ